MPRLTLPVPDKTNRDLKQAAAEQHRSVISLLLTIVDEWLANWRAKRAK